MLDGRSGSRWIPRKIAGSEMITIELPSVAMNTPRVVFDRAVHLYRSGRSVMKPSSQAVRSRRPPPHAGVDVHVKVTVTLTSMLAGPTAIPNTRHTCLQRRRRTWRVGPFPVGPFPVRPFPVRPFAAWAAWADLDRRRAEGSTKPR